MPNPASVKIRGARRAQLTVDVDLLQRARRALKRPSPTEVVEQALAEAIANREIEAALKRLIRRGRGHFANLDKANA